MSAISNSRHRQEGNALRLRFREKADVLIPVKTPMPGRIMAFGADAIELHLLFQAVSGT
jgi:hypothetical protein